MRQLWSTSVAKPSFTGTGTSAKRRRGTGTLRRWRYNEGATYVAIERTSGQKVMLSVEPELALQLLNKYGFKETETFVSISPLMGMKVTYEESSCGMLTSIQPYQN